MDAHAKSDKLHESIGRLQSRKAQVNRELVGLRTKTTTALLDGQDVTHLLGVKLQMAQLLESIDIALLEAQRQVEALRPELQHEDVLGMLSEREARIEKSKALDAINLAGHRAVVADQGRL